MNARQRRKHRRTLTKPATIGGIAVTKYPDWTYKYLPCSKNEGDSFRLQMSDHVQRCLDRFHDRVWHALFSDLAQTKKPLGHDT